MKIITDDGDEYSVQEVKMAEIEPGDVLILKMDGMFSEEARAHFRRDLVPVFPKQRILLLENNVQIEILRQKAKEATE